MPQPDVILQALTMVGVAIIAHLQVRLKNERLEQAKELTDRLDERLDRQDREFRAALEKLRAEFLGAFVPAPLASERDKSFLFRLENCEREIGAMRDKVHNGANTMQALSMRVGTMTEVVGRVNDLANRMEDKARRLSRVEVQIQTLLHEHNRRKDEE